jgi:hypothetical protein
VRHTSAVTGCATLRGVGGPRGSCRPSRKPGGAAQARGCSRGKGRPASQRSFARLLHLPLETYRPLDRSRTVPSVSPRVVMETLGHSQVSLTLNTYSHVLPALQQDAAAKMDAILGSR